MRSRGLEEERQGEEERRHEGRPLLQKEREAGRRELGAELGAERRIPRGRGLKRDDEVGDREEPEVRRQIRIQELPEEPTPRRRGDRLPGMPGEPGLFRVAGRATIARCDEAGERPEERQGDGDPGRSVGEGEEGGDGEERLPPPFDEEGGDEHGKTDQPDLRPAHLHPLGEEGAEPAQAEDEPLGARGADEGERRREGADEKELPQEHPEEPGGLHGEPGEGQEEEVEERLGVGEMVVGDRERRPVERRDAEAGGEHLPGQPQVVVLVVGARLGVGQPLGEEEEHHGGAREDQPESGGEPARGRDRGGRRRRGFLETPGLLDAGEGGQGEGGGRGHLAHGGECMRGDGRMGIPIPTVAALHPRVGNLEPQVPLVGDEAAVGVEERHPGADTEGGDERPETVAGRLALGAELAAVGGGGHGEGETAQGVAVELGERGLGERRLPLVGEALEHLGHDQVARHHRRPPEDFVQIVGLRAVDAAQVVDPDRGVNEDAHRSAPSSPAASAAWP